MNYIRKVALFIGVAATFAMTPFAVQAQTCANSSQTPLTKSRLDQIATNQGIPLSQVGIKFEEFALSTLKPGDPIASNKKLFPSPLRQIKAGIANVQPDGVVTLVVNLRPFFSFTYPESVFYESKAVQRTLLPPSYERYQILGHLDALSRSPGAVADENPAIVFLTTSDVRTISPKTIAEATNRDIGVWHSIGCEIVPPFGNLQMGKAELLNPIVYIIKLRVPTDYGGPGTPGRI
ncbi:MULTISPECIES: hypothetical protein [Nostoc]|uniref:Uncharacterized protein n=1 Tax=Nostoc paludosum FACHB-159 TaxID=2692908 RepID=A0ABR8K480_9NOSO|nr:MULTISPECIES: hypothetical protein [Nostoc]MBD2677159.1 hypothetical protein [Nostoc sp. FACHB-857]MBD2733032.1 hypothetical protein [Nostoc paludosum FACHB-159]